MTAIVRILEAGPLCTVQDLGRRGFASSGVPVSGAADTLSLRIGNRLVGNNECAAGIEMSLVGGAFAFDAPALVCLAGADAPGAIIESSGRRTRPANWSPVVVAAGARVRIGPLESGARSYLCIGGGGVRTAPVLGSRSVLASVGLGGRPRREGDCVPIGRVPRGLRVGPLDAGLVRDLERALTRSTLRVVPGAHSGMFGDSARARLAAVEFGIDPASDRTGVRLRGAALDPDAVSLEESEGVVPGSVQVPPSGEPIVLGADGPTVGGYPVIASVIGADLPALAQLAPGARVRFAWTDLENAHSALRELEALIERVALPGRSAHYVEDRDPGASR